MERGKRADRTADCTTDDDIDRRDEHEWANAPEALHSNEGIPNE